MYPNTVSISRDVRTAVAGAAGYGSLQSGTLTLIATDLPANVQLQKVIGKNPVELPGDAVRMGNWGIYVRTSIVIMGRDIVTSDNGQRFVVNAAYRSPLQWELYCEILEA